MLASCLCNRVLLEAFKDFKVVEARCSSESMEEGRVPSSVNVLINELGSVPRPGGT